jgi:hypothetical protein
MHRRPCPGRLLLPIVLALLLASAPANATSTHRGIYVGVLTLLGVVAVGCLSSGIALRFEAPNAETLMTYKREVSASGTLTIVGGIALVPTAIFAALGGTFLIRRETRAQVSLLPSRSGATVGLAVNF